MKATAVARPLNQLTVREVAALKDKPGRYSDGGGLYLRITPKGARSWVFMTVASGKRVEIGLGAASSVSLATARGIAANMREIVAIGGDPKSVIAPTPMVVAAATPTFGAFAEDYIQSVEAGWRNPVHRQQWRNSLAEHAALLNDLPVDAITTDHLLEVLQPIWMTKSETAKRVRGRIEKILDAAKARKFRPTDAMNPALWRGHLALLLPVQSKLQRGHHAALPWKDAPKFFAELRARKAIAARCLEFTILTAARSGEALGAMWSEIDTDALTWTVPASRMKAGIEHVVPLSTAAAELVRSMFPQDLKRDAPIFAIDGARRSNMAMAMLLRRMGYGHVTTHGFRSTFRDWAGDDTNFPREIVEQALAHTIQSKAERAYRRGNALERRRVLMQDWCSFVAPHQTVS